MDYPGIEGFLGTRASLMLDVVFLAMFAVIPVMYWSIFQVKYRQRYELHKKVQVALGIVLGVAVVLFELDMQINGWRPRASGPSQGPIPTSVWIALYTHLVFAVTTAVLWPVLIIRAIRNFPGGKPSQHSASHVFWARIAAIDMTLTSVTGWIFYWLAFAR